LNNLQNGDNNSASKTNRFTKLFRDKHAELQKQLDQERHARNFYEKVQRQLLEKVHELREAMTEEKRKREKRQAKKKSNLRVSDVYQILLYLNGYSVAHTPEVWAAEEPLRSNTISNRSQAYNIDTREGHLFWRQSGS
jgi:hypothetical protein